MKTKLSVLLLGCLMLVVTPIAANAVSSSIIQSKTNSIAYASGGVGLDEQVTMDQMAKDYNVKFIFVQTPKDDVSGVMVTILNHSGKMLLKTSSNGPWFFAKLPRGDYRVIATLNDHREVKKLNVTGGLETVEFFWRAQPAFIG
jgi:hypothetical protein